MVNNILWVNIAYMYNFGEIQTPRGFGWGVGAGAGGKSTPWNEPSNGTWLQLDKLETADLEQDIQQYGHDVLLFSESVATKLELVRQIEENFESCE